MLKRRLVFVVFTVTQAQTPCWSFVAAHSLSSNVKSLIYLGIKVNLSQCFGCLEMGWEYTHCLLYNNFTAFCLRTAMETLEKDNGRHFTKNMKHQNPHNTPHVHFYLQSKTTTWINEEKIKKKNPVLILSSSHLSVSPHNTCCSLNPLSSIFTSVFGCCSLSHHFPNHRFFFLHSLIRNWLILWSSY